jgi:predicted AAA+ superfamily ATPase
VNINAKSMIKRELKLVIKQKLEGGKAIIVLGPRQTGKTTLLSEIAGETGEFLFLNCDESFVREQLENSDLVNLKRIIGKFTTVFIDEAQRVKNIGLTLKLITDQIKDIQLLVSGSSSLELANEINEPLTGRKWEYMLFPVSWKELNSYSDYLKAMQQLGNRMIYGMYPEVITNTGSETEILKLIADSYLYKDLLSFKGIRKPEILQKLLKALAFQVGNQVSYNELANTLQIDKNTVSIYIDLLEKAFVIFRLQPLSRNLRNEISTSRKFYFFDTGIRNILINNLNPIDFRNDLGALWENFIISERMKFIHYNSIYANTYYWRTHQQQEIDYIEERNGKLYAYEFKWKATKKVRFPVSFSKSYPNSDFQVIDHQNFNDFLGI